MSEPSDAFVYELFSNLEPELYLKHLAIYQVNGRFAVVNKDTWRYKGTRDTLQDAVSLCLWFLE